MCQLTFEILGPGLNWEQVFSSENWTDILYLVASSEAPFQQAVIAVLFFVAWFVFANCG